MQPRPPTTAGVNPHKLSSWLKSPGNSGPHLTTAELAASEAALSIALRITRNILEQPGEPKFRSISVSSKALNTVRDAVVDRVGGADERAAVVFQWMTSALGFVPEMMMDQGGKGATYTSLSTSCTSNSSSKLVFPTSASMQPLDAAAVEAQALLDEVRGEGAARQHAEIARAVEQQREKELQQQSAVASQMQMYQSMSNERRLLKAWAASLCRTLDKLSCRDSSQGDGEWSPEHRNALRFFESMSALRANETAQLSGHLLGILKPLFDEEGNCDPDGAFLHGGSSNTSLTAASSNGSSSSLDNQGAVLLKMILLDAGFSAKKKQDPDSKLIIGAVASVGANQKLRVCIEAIVDSLKNIEQERKEAALQNLSSVKNTEAAERDKRIAIQADKRRYAAEHGEFALNVNPELAQTALGLINDIAAFVELCWKLEDHAGEGIGVVVPHKKIASEYVARFNKGEMAIAELHELKSQWARRYEAEKSRRGVMFTSKRALARVAEDDA